MPHSYSAIKRLQLAQPNDIQTRICLYSVLEYDESRYCLYDLSDA